MNTEYLEEEVSKLALVEWAPGRPTTPPSRPISIGMPEPKTYYPTMEEFKDFKGFMERIEREDQAHLAGICKIVPPAEWTPRRAGYGIETFDVSLAQTEEHSPTKSTTKNERDSTDDKLPITGTCSNI